MEKTKTPLKSKEWTSEFNPFNSWKLLAQVPRWKRILSWKEGQGALPPPTTVSVDPANICDLRCSQCNAYKLMSQTNQVMSKDALMELADFLGSWEAEGFKVKSTCVGGGGSPLLNPHTGDFINRAVDNGVKVGVVTNGTHIHKHLEALCNCDWVGVSVDTAYQHTYREIKGADKFPQVVQNIRALVQKANSNPWKYNLGAPGNGRGVFFKYLLRPETVSEVYHAAKLAKGLGCKGIHIRPIAPPFSDLEEAAKTGAAIPNRFSEEDIEVFRERLTSARALEEDNFKVYGITHKFDGTFNPSKGFSKCSAAYISCVVMPPSSKVGAMTDKARYDISNCCDRRGDDQLTVKNLTSASQIAEYWGSNKHRKTAEAIDVTKCPRCTLSPHIKIYDNVVVKDNMTVDFI